MSWSSPVSPAGPPDVLVFGPPDRPLSRRTRRRTGAALLLVALLALASGISWNWLRSSDPSFTRAKVESLYRDPARAGASRWLPETVSVADTWRRTTTPRTQRPTCSPLLMTGFEPPSLDTVSVELAADNGRTRRRGWSGEVTTYRYADSQAARDKFAQVHTTLKECTDAAPDEDLRARIYDVNVERESRARSDVSCRVILTAYERSVRLHVVRHGNTVSWVVTDDDDPTSAEASRAVSDLVVDGLQEIYRARG